METRQQRLAREYGYASSGPRPIDITTPLTRGAKQWVPDLLGLPGDIADAATYAARRAVGQRNPPSSGLGALSRQKVRERLYGEQPRQQAELSATEEPSGLEEAARLANPLMFISPSKYAQALQNPVLAAGVATAFGLPGDALGGALGVVKPKGGNWLTGSVEDALKGLKRSLPPDEARLRAAGSYESEIARLLPQYQEQAKAPTALNSWIEGPLTKYVKTRMASPEDEVRRLAEEGVLHIPQPRTEGYYVAGNREMAGFPAEGLGKSELAKGWEYVSDAAVNPLHARDFLPRQYRDNSVESRRTALKYPYPETIKKDPWLEKVPPETPVYEQLYATTGPLGFPHLIDELSNALRPDSDLPRALRLTPEAMANLSMEKAVRRVADINTWRAEQAALAERQSAKSILERPALRQYDDQWRWLSIPDTSTPEGLALAKDLGCRGGWCTQGDSAAQNYGSGGNNLHILIDHEGRPHAQIQTRSEPEKTWKDRISPKEYDAIFDQAQNELGFVEGNEHLTDSAKLKQLQDKAVEIANGRYGEHKILRSIQQIKPPENTWSGSRVAEYTKRNPEYQSIVQQKMQDFVRNNPLGGQWSDVGDLQNTGLLANKLHPSGYITRSELEAAAKSPPEGYAPEDFVWPERYAQGGAVETPPAADKQAIIPTSWDVFFPQES